MLSPQVRRRRAVLEVAFRLWVMRWSGEVEVFRVVMMAGNQPVVVTRQVGRRRG